MRDEKCNQAGHESIRGQHQENIARKGKDEAEDDHILVGRRGGLSQDGDQPDKHHRQGFEDVDVLPWAAIFRPDVDEGRKYYQ